MLILNSISNFHGLIFSCPHSASWEWGGRSLTKISYDHVVENVKLANPRSIKKVQSVSMHEENSEINMFAGSSPALWLKY